MPPTPRPWALLHLVNGYELHMSERGYPDTTIHMYSGCLTAFLEWADRRPLAALETLRDYARHFTSRPHTEAGRRRTCAALGLFFAWRVESGDSQELPDVGRFFHPEGSRRGIRLPGRPQTPAPRTTPNRTMIQEEGSRWERVAAAVDRLEREPARG